MSIEQKNEKIDATPLGSNAFCEDKLYKHVIPSGL